MSDTQSSQPVDAAVAGALDHWWGSLGREFGPLTRPQRRALRLLADRAARDQPTRVGDLAALLQFTTAGATRLLDTLVAQGYATRYRAPDTDQRQVYIALTTPGRDALEQSDRVFAALVAASLAPLSDAERQMLATLLARLTGEASDPLEG